MSIKQILTRDIEFIGNYINIILKGKVLYISFKKILSGLIACT